MVTEEVEKGLLWTVKCQECKSNAGGKGIKSVPQAEKWIVEHSKETGHLCFNMTAGIFAMVVTNITDAAEENAVLARK